MAEPASHRGEEVAEGEGFRLPIFFLEVFEHPPQGTSFCQVEIEHWGIACASYKTPQVQSYVLGSPVIHGSLVLHRIAEEAPVHLSDRDWLTSLDSEFALCVIEEPSRRVHLVSSRFGSPPLFYYHRHGSLLVSFSFFDLWKRLQERRWLEIREEGFYELLAYKRLFGYETHARGAYLLPPATHLVFHEGEIRMERYYLPDFRQKTRHRLTHAAEELADALVASIRKKLSDGSRPGLFLTGGRDSRLVLAALSVAGIRPTCFTVNPSENREVRIAKTLAELVGVPHVFLPLQNDHYRRYFLPALQVTGCLQAPLPLYLGYREILRRYADVALHGHAFDYFFQGLYLPEKPFSLFGRHMPYRRLAPLPSSLDRYFLDHIHYRLREATRWEMVKPSYREAMREYLLRQLTPILEEAMRLASDPYDIFEYLSFYCLVRHYSYCDHWGMNTNLPQRTVAFDNDVYSLYQRLPVAYRFDARILRAALARLHPALAAAPNSNTGCRAVASSLEETFVLLMRSLASKLSFSQRESTARDWHLNRSGLPLVLVLRDQFQDRVVALLSSGRLERLSWLDMDCVRREVQAFLDDPTPRGQKGQFLWGLLAIDLFLAEVEEVKG